MVLFGCAARVAWRVDFSVAASKISVFAYQNRDYRCGRVFLHENINRYTENYNCNIYTY